MTTRDYFIVTFVANFTSRWAYENQAMYFQGLESEKLANQIPVEDIQKLAEKLWLRVETK